MADTKQYIVGTSDQAGKIKHKDYTEWVDSVNGKVVKSNSTSSADKANGTIITEASNLLHNSNTRIFDAIDIEWAPYKITYQGVTKSLRTTNDLINNISSTYSYSCGLGNLIDSSINNINNTISSLDVSSGTNTGYKSLYVSNNSDASDTTTTKVITNISQNDGLITYEYAGLYMTPTLISKKQDTSGKFVTKIDGTSEADDNNFNYELGNIEVKTTGTGNVVTDINVDDSGDIAVTKGTNVSANNSTVNFYLSNSSTNGNTSSGSFTTNQSSDGSIYLNNVALTDKENTFSSKQTFNKDVIAAGGNFNIEYVGGIPSIKINGLGSITLPTITTATLTVNNTDNSGVLIVNGTGKSTGGWFVESDINYKEIIDDCKITIDEIANLPIFDYIWKLDEEKKTHTGSSAQSVENILPNLVTEDDKGIKSLDYASLGTIAGVVACREICKLRDKLDKIEKLISNK